MQSKIKQQMTTIRNNACLMAEIGRIAEVAGYEPEGMTDKELDDLAPAFGL